MYSKRSRPLEDKALKIWAESMGPQELLSMGWSSEKLITAAAKYDYCYRQVGGQVSSLIIYQDMGGQAFEVLFLTTVPEQRKRGEMSELLRGLKNISESREIWLECREDNHGAISLYQKLGFAESGRRSSYYKDGMTAILFNF